jgi:NAD+ kinase
MDADGVPQRIAVVVHPTRSITTPLAELTTWAVDRGLEVVQTPAVGQTDRRVAPLHDPEPGDLIVALGGDGTVLAALRASAAVGVPVLGTACGSVGALTAVTAGGLRTALDRYAGGDWRPRRLPALAIEPETGEAQWAVNDFVAVRHGAGQLVADVAVDGELYVRLAGDGVIVATPLGSSAYSMAAGGPVLAAGTAAFVCTPLAMHGGDAAPLVVPGASTLDLKLHPGFAGFEIEIDGHDYPASDVNYRLSLYDAKVTLVAFGDPSLGLTELRMRGLVTDSARVRARDARADAASTPAG